MHHLRSDSVSVVLDDDHGAPMLRYWGPALPSSTDLNTLVAAQDRGRPHGVLDVEAPITILPESALGYPGLPGVRGHRTDGSGWAPRLASAGCSGSGANNTLTFEAIDATARLRVTTRVSLGHALILSVTVTNEGDDTYWLDAVDIAIPVPSQALEVLDFTGRWARELQPRRRHWASETLVAESRRGRTSHDHLPLIFVGEFGFGEWTGCVWGAHLAWSGNSRVVAECLSDGRKSLRLGELLHPGEVRLAPGESYRSPDIIAVHSPDGLTPATWGFHRYARSLPAAPQRPRPVLLNTWEAVYFDHDPVKLRDLADRAAECGVERFVLDDGWFSSRRSDRSGLGDWWVSPERYPEGLGTLVDHVNNLGMEFGLWVEPEMVNPDSDLYRSHPDWTLSPSGHAPVLGRNQLVLDLTNPQAFEHVRSALDALLSQYRIAFLKWDMNRDHAAATGSDGRAATHRQTLAVYALIDALRARHPRVEIESCSSGGGRIDLGILRRAERVWASDSNDPLERQVIQRSASMLLPAEFVGAHIGPSPAHTTGRRHSLAFRGLTALFGHLGLELDLTAMSDTERERLSDMIALHRSTRELLHSGDTVRFDHPDRSLVAHGVYAADRTEAWVSLAQVSSPDSLTGSAVRLPGLDPQRTYRVEVVALHRAHRIIASAVRQPSWVEHGISLTGAQLKLHGLQPPILQPESGVLLHLLG